MFRRRWFGRPVALVLAVLVACGPLAPVLRAASARQKLAQLSDGVSARVHGALEKTLRSICARASRSQRVHLELKMAFADHAGRLFYDVQGTARVKVPGKTWRASIASMQQEGRSYTMTSNGSVAVDFTARPLEVRGDEVVFAIQLDLSIQLRELLAELARVGAATLGAVAIGGLASQLADLASAVRTEVVGDAIGVGVSELSSFLSAEAGTVAWSKLGVSGGSLRHLLSTRVTPWGLVQHFAAALIYAGSVSVSQGALTTLGAGALTAAFGSFGGSVLGVLVTAGAAYWFGDWVFQSVAVKLPILWRLNKIGKLWATARRASGARQQAAVARLQAYQAEVAARLRREMDGANRRWTFFELMTEYLAKRVADPPEGFALEAYRPLVEAARKLLQMRTISDQDWYAARMLLQLKGAIGELPGGGP